MSFEDEFPEFGLKDIQIIKTNPEAAMLFNVYKKLKLEHKYCLDKQKVKEVLQKVVYESYEKLKEEGWNYEDSVPSPEMIQEELIKELGL